LHERLTQRFIDRRTSVLMKRLRQNEDLMAAVNSDGEVLVEGEYVGRLQGFVFVPDLKAEGVHGTVLRAASEPVIALEIAARAARLVAAADIDIQLSDHGRLIWDGQPVAMLKASDTPLAPRIELIAGEELSGASREAVAARLDAWAKAHIAAVLAPLVALRDAEDVTGLARGIAFRLIENFGSLRRETVAEDVRSLDQASRGQLRKYGVRFGGYSIFMPALLKPAPARALLTLWTLTRKDVADPFEGLPQPPTPGLTSVPADPAAPEGFYDALGFRVCGGRAVRLDMLERIADLIRPVITARSYNGGFVVTPAMMSLVGCSGEEFSNLLKGLGYRPRLEKVKPPKVEEKPVETPKFIVETISSESHAPAPAVEASAEPMETPAETVNEEIPASVEAPEEAAASEEIPIGEAGAEATPVEPEAELVELEIWRPQRRHKPEQRPRHHRRPVAAASAEGAPAGESETGDKKSEEPRRRHSRERYKGKRDDDKGAGVRFGNDDKKADNADKRGNRDKFARKEGRRDGRKDDRGAKGGERREWTSAPPRREREIDPDSPFAALAVLKERGLGN
jgi:ATP-dependent RNA helicase SUPV3L1/SUV3